MKITLLFLIAAMLVGCGTPLHEVYKKNPYTPSSFDYTHSRADDGFKPSEHYFGFSWDLK